MDFEAGQLVRKNVSKPVYSPTTYATDREAKLAAFEQFEIITGKVKVSRAGA